MKQSSTKKNRTLHGRAEIQSFECWKMFKIMAFRIFDFGKNPAISKIIFFIFLYLTIATVIFYDLHVWRNMFSRESSFGISLVYNNTTYLLHLEETCRLTLSLWNWILLSSISFSTAFLCSNCFIRLFWAFICSIRSSSANFSSI